MTATDVFDWPLFLRKLDAREHYWNARRISYPRQDAVPFMPYSLPLFAALLVDAVLALPGDACYDEKGRAINARFLDVGCGPGTKMALAEAMFDLSVNGIDIVPEFVAEAQADNLDAEVIDAFDYPGYDQHDIVLVNRPSGLQVELETLVMDKMRPGGILIAINWHGDPANRGWRCISQEYGEPVRGVWAKPDGIVHAVSPTITGPTACCGKLPGTLPHGDSLSPDLGLVTCREHPPLGIEEGRKIGHVKLESYGPDLASPYEATRTHMEAWASGAYDHPGEEPAAAQEPEGVTRPVTLDLGDDPDGDNTLPEDTAEPAAAAEAL